MTQRIKLFDKPLHDHVSVYVNDEPDASGANHLYAISVDGGVAGATTHIQFQKGGAVEAGINGISDEALLAILIHRARGFSNGAFPSREGSLALTKMEEAMHWLEARTRDRVSRDVEGKSLK